MLSSTGSASRLQLQALQKDKAGKAYELADETADKLDDFKNEVRKRFVEGKKHSEGELRELRKMVEILQAQVDSGAGPSEPRTFTQGA